MKSEDKRDNAFKDGDEFNYRGVDYFYIDNKFKTDGGSFGTVQEVRRYIDKLIETKRSYKEMEITPITYTTKIKYGKYGDALIVQSSSTTPDVVASLARNTKKEYDEWNDNTEKWLKIFPELLPDDCIITGKEVTI